MIESIVWLVVLKHHGLLKPGAPASISLIGACLFFFFFLVTGSYFLLK